MLELVCVCIELIWIILQVDEGGVLAVTQLLSQFGSELAHSQSQTTVNPFQSAAAATFNDSAVYSQYTSSSPRNAPNANAPRHSSLPSSPRWYGEVSTSPVHFSAESLRARAVLFQVCNAFHGFVYLKSLSNEFS